MQNDFRIIATDTCVSCGQKNPIFDADVCSECYNEIMGFDLPLEDQEQEPL